MDVNAAVEFLAQAAHESSSFNRLEESLSYTPDRLMAVWPRRFPTRESALAFAGKPHELAEYVYGGRMGNTSPGDGWKYRGRGFGITGRDNYARVARLLNDSLILTCPDRLCTKVTAAMAFAAWWASHPELRDLADAGDTVSITRIVNGGSTGLAERVRLRDAWRLALGTPTGAVAG